MAVSNIFCLQFGFSIPFSFFLRQGLAMLSRWIWNSWVEPNLLPYRSKYWDYRCVLPYPATYFLNSIFQEVEFFNVGEVKFLLQKKKSQTFLG
jgi:hypothetical protein